MNLHAGVKLAARALGFLLIVWRLPYVLADLEPIYGFVRNYRYIPLYFSANAPEALFELGIWLQFLFGFYLLFRGRRVVTLLLRALPGVAGVCLRCGYDVRGLEGGRCPECGAKIPDRP